MFLKPSLGSGPTTGWNTGWGNFWTSRAGWWTVAYRRCFLVLVLGRSIAIPPAPSPIPPKTPAPSRGFHFSEPVILGDPEAGAGRQGGKLIDRVGAGAAVRPRLLVVADRHRPMPIRGVRVGHGQ